MVNFENGASGKTPINKTNLNKMQTTLSEEIHGTVLYASSTTDNVTLLDSASNYNYLEIFFRKRRSV